MNKTYTDVRAGERLDIAVEFVTRRSVDCDGGRVHRLLVADKMGEQFAILVTPDSSSLWDVRTGETYKILGLLGSGPVDAEVATGAGCPDCGSQLREGSVVDTVGPAVAQAATEFDLSRPFGIADEQTTVSRVQEDTPVVDDWQPMNESFVVESPDFVCKSCGCHLRAHEVNDGHRSAPSNATESASIVESQVNECLNNETVGLAAGGAKDVGNFRENIANEYTPQPEAISDEGLFYDYYFETGERTETDALFAPRYATAVSEHPLDGETEQYLSVGLDSTLSVSDFERPSLELVAVLDVSGSMDSSFDSYYYDEHGRKREAEDDAATKLEAATQSLCALTEQLHEDDQLGVVLFNNRAHVAKPLRDVGLTDMPAIRRHIRDIAAGGGTNLTDGFEAALDMLIDGSSSPLVERRVVFMTDMMPNTGATSESELTELFRDAAVDGVHTTFIGMGIDANAELADTLSGIRGANHYFIHSASEFERRLGEEFDYMVSPLVYDLNLELLADGYEIKAVHGSPSADAAADRLMHVGTLFPSAKEDGKARGGVILVRAEQTEPNADLELVASWTERGGGEHTERVSVTMPEKPESFEHVGVQKAVALSRYARELRAWAREVHERADSATGVDDWLLPDQRGQHERESVPLVVPDEYAERFESLQDYLKREMEAVEDETFQQEVNLLKTLSQEASETRTEVTD